MAVSKAPVLLALACALALSCGCATSGDPYFLNTDSDANVYVAPVPCWIEKVAIMPFKAPTELIGTTVADLLTTEMLRAGRYELVERSQMAQVLSEAELAPALRLPLHLWQLSPDVGCDSGADAENICHAAEEIDVGVVSSGAHP